MSEISPPAQNLLFVIFLVLVFVCLSSFCFAEEPSQGKSIETQVGQSFTITLEANATTGYQWQFAKPLDESILRLISSKYLPDKTEIVGVGGKQVWIFQALKVGKTAVSFKYVRSWEKDNPPEKEESFEIIIGK